MKRYEFVTFLDRLTVLQAQATAKAVALDQVTASLGLALARGGNEPVRAREGHPGGSTGAETTAGEVGSDVREMFVDDVKEAA